MLLYFPIAIALAEPPECPAPPVSAVDRPVLDLWSGTLHPAAHSPGADTAGDEVAEEAVAVEGAERPPADEAVRVDEAWPGEVVPELRSASTRALRRKLGPPSADRADELAWEAPYGCLVVELEAGAVAAVAVHHRPCAAILAEEHAPR